jgi:hypothetical protein
MKPCARRSNRCWPARPLPGPGDDRRRRNERRLSRAGQPSQAPLSHQVSADSGDRLLNLADWGQNRTRLSICERRHSRWQPQRPLAADSRYGFRLAAYSDCIGEVQPQKISRSSAGWLIERRKWHQQSSVRPVSGRCSGPIFLETNDFPWSNPVHSGLQRLRIVERDLVGDDIRDDGMG